MSFPFPALVRALRVKARQAGVIVDRMYPVCARCGESVFRDPQPRSSRGGGLSKRAEQTSVRSSFGVVQSGKRHSDTVHGNTAP